MKILSLRNLNPYNYESDVKMRNCKYNTVSDSVSFEARQKIVKKGISQIESRNQHDILTVIKRMVDNDKTKQLFTKIAQVLLGAAVITEYLTTGEDSDTKKLLRTELKKAGVDVDKELKKDKRKPGKKPIYSEKELKTKMQDLAKQGYTQSQIAESLGFSRSYTAALMKKFDIKTGRSKVYGQVKNNNVKKYINKDAHRAEYTKYLANYPKLLESYEEIISEHLSQPKDEKINENLALIEQIFSRLYTNDKNIQKIRAKYFEGLENKYADDLEKVTEGLKIHLGNGAEVYSFLNCLINYNNITKSDLKDYIQCKILTFPEFLDLNKEHNSFTLKSIKTVKEHDNINFLHFEKDKNGDQNYRFWIQFKEGIPLKDKLNDIVLTNEALNGPLEMHSNTILHPIDKLKSELIKHAIYDKDVNFSYNILRFIEPEKTEQYRYNHGLSKRIDLLDVDTKEFKELKKYIINRFKNIDENNEKLNILYNILNNDDIFNGALGNNHAKLRFMGRFVLNRPTYPNKLEEKTKKFVSVFEKELNFRLETGCRIFPYANSHKGIAPSLYLGKTSLGNYAKFTLNKDGQIQTIYRDIPESFRNRDLNQELELSQQ